MISYNIWHNIICDIISNIIYDIIVWYDITSDICVPLHHLCAAQAGVHLQSLRQGRSQVPGDQCNAGECMDTPTRSFIIAQAGLVDVTP